MAAVNVRKTYFMVLVADMDRAMRFYSDAFAVTAVIGSPYWSEFMVAGATIALHPGGGGAETVTGLGFEVDDVPAALRQVEAAGGRVSRPPRERPAEGILVAEFADTEGNLITIAENRR